MTMLQYPPNTRRMYSIYRVKLSPQSVPEQALSLGFTRICLIAQKIRCTLRYEICRKETDVEITGPQDEESNKSGMSKV